VAPPATTEKLAVVVARFVTLVGATAIVGEEVSGLLKDIKTGK
jgi:hypothetical protein